MVKTYMTGADALTVLSRRTLRRAFAFTAGLAAVAGLAVGLALGSRFLPSVPPVAGSADGAMQRYMASELGQLSASLNQIEPRMQRLMVEVDRLRDFDEHLHRAFSARPGTGARKQAGPLGGEGGPERPPQVCTARSNSVTALAKQTQCVLQTLAALEAELGHDQVALATYPGRLPTLAAKFGSPFGNRVDPFTHHLAFHPGLDLVASAGTAILATAAGRVSFSGEKPGYGKVVEIDHGHGIVTRYAHASRLLVHAGQPVLPGDVIAEVGSTGRSTGPHLHFEVLRDGMPTDPEMYLTLFDHHAPG
ncbi:Membrane proteins related to metalloendopeptidases [Burkholderia singularis]|uniref:Membrane proteins related to metalloendopeptidases n=2 Tax=Burkholderia singularis TaxID=1503053 RepID=A0A238H3I0_9BURK|nr:Membrane proteins related to metalloendopeptidases [Burkholderia singularis]